MQYIEIIDIPSYVELLTVGHIFRNAWIKTLLLHIVKYFHVEEGFHHECFIYLTVSLVGTVDPPHTYLTL